MTWIRSIRDRNGNHRILAESSSEDPKWRVRRVERDLRVAARYHWIGSLDRGSTRHNKRRTVLTSLRLISSEIPIVNLYSVFPDIILRRVHPATYHFSSISVFHFFVNPHPPFSILFDFSIIFQRDCHIVDLIETMITRFEKSILRYVEIKKTSVMCARSVEDWRVIVDQERGFDTDLVGNCTGRFSPLLRGGGVAAWENPSRRRDKRVRGKGEREEREREKARDRARWGRRGRMEESRQRRAGGGKQEREDEDIYLTASTVLKTTVVHFAELPRGRRRAVTEDKGRAKRGKKKGMWEGKSRGAKWGAGGL